MIELEGVTRHYRMGETAIAAVDGVDARIAAGEFVAILGPSGSGKSTLMHLIGALDRPTTGRVTVAGHDLSRLDSRAAAEYRNRNIGFVFQSFYLQPHLTAQENVALPLKLAGVPAAERQRIARERLESVGLGARADHLPTQLSGGEQQRVCVARALANDPRVLLADEPTGNLDTRTGRGVLDLFLRVQRECGVTLVLVTHDPEVAKHAGRVIRMRDGKVESDEPSPGGAAPAAGRRSEQPALASATGRVAWSDLARDVVLGFKRHRLRTALTGAGIAIGAFAIVLMVGLGFGLHDFIRTQAESVNEPRTLWVVNSGFDWNNVIGERAVLLGKTPVPLKEKSLAMMSKLRAGFEPFTDAQVAEVRSIPGVLDVRPRTLVILDGVRLAEAAPAGGGDAGTSPANDERALTAADRTGAPEVFAETFYVAYGLVRAEDTPFDLSAGRVFRAGEGRGVVISYQYAEAWGLADPAELVGREVEIIVPALSDYGEFSFIQPERVAARYRGFRARVVGVTRKTMMSTMLYLPASLGEEIMRFQFGERIGRGMEDRLAQAGRWMELVRLAGDPEVSAALRAGSPKERELADGLRPERLLRLLAGPEAARPGGEPAAAAGAGEMLSLLAGFARLRELVRDEDLRAALARRGGDAARLGTMLAEMLSAGAAEAAPGNGGGKATAPAAASQPWGARLCVRVGADEALPAVRAEIEKRGYRVQSLQDNLSVLTQVFAVVDAFLSSFGLIALFVAAFGIANTLIMAVYERTREIGVMKAVGAPESLIHRLFALEAAAIGLLGGTAGAAAAVLAGWTLNRWGVGWIVPGWEGVPFFQASAAFVAVAILFCALVGLGAGLYPARRAARLDPITALRSE